ncbi:MAG: hypothetical protein ACK4L7_10675, partial [Flavobacteriales bacterium]
TADAGAAIKPTAAPAEQIDGAAPTLNRNVKQDLARVPSSPQRQPAKQDPESTGPVPLSPAVAEPGPEAPAKDEE